MKIIYNIIQGKEQLIIDSTAVDKYPRIDLTSAEIILSKH